MSGPDFFYVNPLLVNSAGGFEGGEIPWDATTSLNAGAGAFCKETARASVGVVRYTLTGMSLPLFRNVRDTPSVAAQNTVLALGITSWSRRSDGPTATNLSTAIVRLPTRMVETEESVFIVIDAINLAIDEAAAAYRDVLYSSGLAYPNVPRLVSDGGRLSWYLPIDWAASNATYGGWGTWVQAPLSAPTTVKSTVSSVSVGTRFGLVMNEYLASLIPGFCFVNPPPPGGWVQTVPTGTTAQAPNRLLYVTATGLSA